MKTLKLLELFEGIACNKFKYNEFVIEIEIEIKIE